MRVLLVHNPNAGDGRHEAAELAHLIRNTGADVECVEHRGPRLLNRLEERFDLIAIAGGDGTVTRVLAKLPGRSPPVTILPLGTANNLACALGIRGDPAALIAGFEAGALQPMDVGRFVRKRKTRRFFEAVGFGALAHALGNIDERPDEPADKIGEGRLTLRRLLRTQRPLDLTLALDGTLATPSVLLLEIAVIGFLGPQLRLAPDVEPGSGWLQVVTLPESRRDQMLAWIDADDHDEAAPVDVSRARRVEVAWRHAAWHRDDRFRVADAVPGRATVALDRGALCILRPATPPPPPPPRHTPVGLRAGGGD